ncbi:benzoate 4-monooxygenase cytochrome P450 [Mytilinidion resinicola]|uniref:Benzoate 4-monooxygenase cytochrome P450 n=1 Tax=Mytilinidion resinicola TaxID=574789 RepID=A0A6A6Z3X2_9PEZI|nr:benzoate 4-monooxygenase cytochrome P450 [Mytilinidion resinicola]KAF2815851.1 benzoate 4-monooxygenase cytochrome P450 [Mytilinidion resinicola]
MALASLKDHTSSILPSLSYTELLAFAGTTYAIYSVLRIIYRLTLHPLAKYPGNFIEKISDWPLIYYCYNGDRHLRIQEAHRKYGTVVRIGPNTLDFNTATALSAIHRDRNANVKKADWYDTVDAGSGARSVQSVVDKPYHAFRRKMLLPAFSETALREHEKFIDNNVTTMIDEMCKECNQEDSKDVWTSPVDFMLFAAWYGFDYTADLAFGSPMKLLENEHRYVPDVVKWTSQFLYYVGYLPFAPLIRPILIHTSVIKHLPSKNTRDTAKFFQIGEERLVARQAAEERSVENDKDVRRDIFHYIFHARDETGVALSQEEMIADASFFLAAGSDGVGIALSAALFYLLQNPESLTTLTTELRSSFASVDEIRLPKLNQLPYLYGVVEEALRLVPCVSSQFPREVLPGGMTVDDQYIPAGTVVGTSPYALHHNEENYPDSFAFKPERWLGDEESVARAKSAFNTFSVGQYNCIGKNVAYLAIKLVIAKLLWGYEVRVPEEVGLIGGGGRGAWKGDLRRENEYQLLDYLVGYREGPIVQFRKRKV